MTEHINGYGYHQQTMFSIAASITALCPVYVGTTHVLASVVLTLFQTHW
jgi:hypothetical protein